MLFVLKRFSGVRYCFSPRSAVFFPRMIFIKKSSGTHSTNSMKTLVFIAVTAFALVAADVGAQILATYDFDEVEVKYAAEFVARPIVKPGTVDAENWAVRIAGGVDKTITVLYGVVDLKKGGTAIGSEEFIKVSGAGGSERFLLNSAAYDYYTGTANYRKLKSFFWSAKKLEGTSIVKDFTPPIISIALYREFNESQQPQSMTLAFSNDGQRAVDEFWTRMPAGNFYEADMGVLNQSGDSDATVAQ